MGKNDEFFYCYSRRLHKFFGEKAIPYISEGLTTKKQIQYWQYRNNEVLSDAFEEFKSIYGLNKHDTVRNKEYLYANDLGDLNKYKFELLIINDVASLKHTETLTKEQVEELGKYLNIKSKATLNKRIKMFCENGFLVENNSGISIPLYSESVNSLEKSLPVEQ